MHDDVMAQARSLHETVRLLRMRMMSCCAGQVTDAEGRPIGPELTMPQMNLLMVVREREQASVKDLATALQVSPPSASSMVDRLVDVGVLTREQSQVDRRGVAIRLTEAGRERIDLVEETILFAIVELLEKVGPDYAKKWCDVYEKLREILMTEPHMDAPVSAQRSK
jgi:DNA-binding MarR family transcriptional regulator